MLTWFCAARRKTGKVRPTPKPRGISGRTIPPTGMKPNANFHRGVVVESVDRPAIPTIPMATPTAATVR